MRVAIHVSQSVASRRQIALTGCRPRLAQPNCSIGELARSAWTSFLLIARRTAAFRTPRRTAALLTARRTKALLTARRATALLTARRATALLTARRATALLTPRRTATLLTTARRTLRRATAFRTPRPTRALFTTRRALAVLRAFRATALLATRRPLLVAVAALRSRLLATIRLAGLLLITWSSLLRVCITNHRAQGPCPRGCFDGGARVIGRLWRETIRVRLHRRLRKVRCASQMSSPVIGSSDAPRTRPRPEPRSARSTFDVASPSLYIQVLGFKRGSTPRIGNSTVLCRSRVAGLANERPPRSPTAVHDCRGQARQESAAGIRADDRADVIDRKSRPRVGLGRSGGGKAGGRRGGLRRLGGRRVVEGFALDGRVRAGQVTVVGLVPLRADRRDPVGALGRRRLRFGVHVDRQRLPVGPRVGAAKSAADRAARLVLLVLAVLRFVERRLLPVPERAVDAHQVVVRRSGPRSRSRASGRTPRPPRDTFRRASSTEPRLFQATRSSGNFSRTDSKVLLRVGEAPLVLGDGRAEERGLSPARPELLGFRSREAFASARRPSAISARARFRARPACRGRARRPSSRPGPRP